MDFSLPPVVVAFQTELRALLDELVDDDLLAEVRRTGTSQSRALSLALGERGWLRAAMPGPDADPLALYVLFSEMECSGAPYEALAVDLLVAGVLSQVGSPVQIERVCEPLLQGRASMCLGYSEPDAGSDLTSIATRATRDGESWRINGSKMWTTMAHEADWMLLLARTDPSAGPRRGDTMFLVPMDRPGIQVDRVCTMGGERVNAVFLSDVALEDEWRIGEVDGAWSVMTLALALERGVLGNSQHGVRMLATTCSWLSDSAPELLADPSVREAVVQVAIDNQVGALLGLRAALGPADLAAGVAGSMVKLFVSERYAASTTRLQQLCGPAALLAHGETGAAADGWLDHHVRHSPVTRTAGGTTEINRNNVAERHLGLPRTRPSTRRDR